MRSDFEETARNSARIACAEKRVHVAQEPPALPVDSLYQEQHRGRKESTGRAGGLHRMRPSYFASSFCLISIN